MGLTNLKKQAKAGDHLAQAKLSLAYYTEDGLERDRKKASKWLKKASKDRAALNSVFTEEALASDAIANYLLASDWNTSLENKKDEDVGQAFQFLINSAKLGEKHAQFSLGISCKYGDYGLPAEYHGYEHAIYWFEKALFHGHPQAARYLYPLYADDTNASTLDYEKAIKIVMSLVENGGYDEASELGDFYANGHGTSRDLSKAAKWLFIAGSQHHEEITDKLKAIKEEMGESDYAAARADAIDWIENNGIDAKGYRHKFKILDPITYEVLKPVFVSNPSETQIAESLLKAEKSRVSRDKQQSKLIKKWHQYCAGSSKVEYNDLHYLLSEFAPTDEELEDIFRYYDCRDELIQRYKTIRNMGSKPVWRDEYFDEVTAYAREDLLMKYNVSVHSEEYSQYENVLKELSEELINGAPARLVESSEFDRAGVDIFYEIMLDVIGGDAARRNVVGFSALEEALYGLASDSNLAHYVLTPLSSLDLNYDAYLKIEQTRGQYKFVGGEILVLSKNI